MTPCSCHEGDNIFTLCPSISFQNILVLDFICHKTYLVTMNTFCEEVWWLRWEGKRLRTESFKLWQRQEKLKKILVFSWLLGNLWDVPLRICHIRLHIHLAINNHSYTFHIGYSVDPESAKMEKKVSYFHKMCASPCYSLRKQVIVDDASFNFSLYRCPTVHISKKELPKQQDHLIVWLNKTCVYILCADANIGPLGQPLKKSALFVSTEF